MNDQIFSLIAAEEERQQDTLMLIPSENYASLAVRAAVGSVLSNKYSEGYPGKRYYEGNVFVDQIEALAIDRAKQIFGVPHVNVQAYSGSPANSAIQFALAEPGDTIMGLSLSSGGHLTHGHPGVTFSGKFFHSVQFGLDAQARIDYDDFERKAKAAHPKVIILGTTAYPFILDWARARQIADSVGAWLVADISHIVGLVIAGVHPTPVPYAHVVMTTTHKSLRGPRGAMIMATEEGMKKDANLGKKIDAAVFPGLQGGPHNQTTAAIAIALQESMQPEFMEYGKKVIVNAQKLAQALLSQDIALVGGGTENHLMVMDFSGQGEGGGTLVAIAMNAAGLVANKNTVPGDPAPFYPSGVRLGTPAITTRGMGEKEMVKIADWIARTAAVVRDAKLTAQKSDRAEYIRNFRDKVKVDPKLLAIADEVKAVCQQFPTKNI